MVDKGEGSLLAEILALTPVSFQYTPEYNGDLANDPNFNCTFVGFIAEQVAQIDASHTGRYLRPVLAEGRSRAYAAGR